MAPDVFVIGGGPVGLAAALAARRKGLTVTVADARTPPIDKCCGEGLLPAGLTAARQLGVEIPESQSHPLRGIRFCSEVANFAADFPGLPGRGVRRTELHAAMVHAAERAGVRLEWGRSIQSLGECGSKWIVGADGTSSRVRQWAGLHRFRRDTRRYGFRMHYAIAPWSDYVEVYWGDGCQIYVTPVGPREVGIALISRDSRLRVREALQIFPELSARLAGAGTSSAERGALTSTRTLPRVTENNVALIGDASGSVDAITGEGLSLGFQQAFAIAYAMAGGDLHSYERSHRRLGARPRWMADALLTMDRHRLLRRYGLRTLAAWPGLFGTLLAFHAGE